jgi:hypothetical protein
MNEAHMAGHALIGFVLVGAGGTLAFTSMQANAWFGYSFTTMKRQAESFQGCR